MYINRILLLSLLFFLPFLIYGQEITLRKDLKKKARKQYREAIAKGRAGDFEKAISLFDKVLKKHPLFIDGILRKAGMLYNLERYDASEALFLKVIDIAPDYNPDIYRSLAHVYKEQKQYEKAGDNYELYLEKETENKAMRSRVKKILANCRFAADAIKNPVPFKPVRMNDAINSSNSEYMPVLTADGEQLIFTMRIHGQEDFFVSKKEDGHFTSAEPMSDLNSPINEGAHTLSADGTIMVFTGCDRTDGYGSCDLYYSKYTDGEWTTPINMGKAINTAAWESQPSLSPDGKKLFFSSNRKGTKGGRDIWYTERLKNGRWAKPINLGAPINTRGDEESPFIHADEKTLYFRSNFHPGMGGFDIFLSKRTGLWDWSEPKNLGYPINTEKDEGALTVALNGEDAFFASDQAYEKDDYRSNHDIYTFKLHSEIKPEKVTFVKGKIADAVTKIPLKARILIQDSNTGDTIATFNTNRKGNFLRVLSAGKKYAFTTSKQGYLFHSEHFNLDSVFTVLDPYLLEIELLPVPEETEEKKEDMLSYDKPVIMNNIFFETGSSQLLETSQFEIDRLADLLEKHQNLRIKIIGHTDDVGSEEDNLQLSEDRAKAVYSALIEKGIAENRLEYEGKGETSPIASNEDEEGRRTNRRTEFLLLKN